MDNIDSSNFLEKKLIKNTDITFEKLLLMLILGIPISLISHSLINYTWITILSFIFIAVTVYLIIGKNIPGIILIAIIITISLLFYLEKKDLDKKIDELNEEIQQKDALNKIHENDIIRLESSKHTLELITKQLEKNLNDSSDVIMELKNEKIALTKIIKQKEDSINNFGKLIIDKNKKIKKLNKDIENKRNRIFILSKENNYLKSTIDELRQENAKLKQKNTDSNKQQKGKSFYNQALVYEELGNNAKKKKDKIVFYQKAVDLFESAENNGYKEAKVNEKMLRELLNNLR